MTRQKHKQHRRSRRSFRTRSRIHGTAERPRLSVFRSLRHIQAQLINDDTGATLASASDLKQSGAKQDRAVAVGTDIAAKAQAAGIDTVVFDRGAYRYHGRVKAVADAARAAGLKF